MAFFASPRAVSICSLKLRERKSHGVVPLVIKPMTNQNGDDKNSSFSRNITNMNIRLKIKSTVVSALEKTDSSTIPTGEIGEDKEIEGSKGTTKVSWVDLYLPEKTRPYARLARVDRPIVTWLYIWPCFWAIALAASPRSLPDLGLLALFGIASLPIRGYACTINDIFDRDMDQKVARSKQRPIASGEVTLLQGFCFLFLQLLLCLAILLPGLNNYSKVMGVPFFPLFSLYPLMKRLTYWPQAYLGVSFNWITFVAWTAVKGSLDLSIVLPLYISLSFWTLAYDTIYAHQDRADDVKAGVKSTAVLFGDLTKALCTVFNIVAIGCLAISGLNAKMGRPFYASLFLAAAHLAWQVITVDLSNSDDCKNKFISNIWVGAIVFIGACLGKLLN